MKKVYSSVFLLFLSFLSFSQVSVFPSSSGGQYWLSFIREENSQSGDLLFYKSHTQPNSEINQFTVVLGRYDLESGTEIATVTLTGIPGAEYGWGDYLSPLYNGLATDNDGNVYITGYGTGVVTRFNGPIPESGNATLSPQAQYTIPNSNGEQPIAVDGSGNLYIGGLNDSYYPTLYRILKADLTQSGEASAYFAMNQWHGMYDIDFDKPGNIYISDGDRSVFKYSQAGTLTQTITFNGASNVNIFASEIAESGVIFINTGNAHSIVKYDPVSGIFSDFAGVSGTSGDALDASLAPPYSQARFDRPTALALNSSGLLVTYDENTDKTYFINAREAGVTLPVKLLHFGASVRSERLECSWKVAEEESVIEYVVETSTDGVHFSVAGKMPSSLSGTYSLYVPHESGTLFVRLMIVELDGKKVYSQVIRVGASVGSIMKAVLSNDKIVIQANEGSGRRTEIQLFNTSGQKIFGNSYQLVSGQNYIHLPSGLVKTGQVYIIHTVDGDKSQTFKVFSNY